MQSTDFDLSVGNGYTKLEGNITLAGYDHPSYRIHIAESIAGGQVSGFFTIEGKGEHIAGVVTGPLGKDRTLTGTYWA